MIFILESNLSFNIYKPTDSAHDDCSSEFVLQVVVQAVEDKMMKFYIRNFHKLIDL